MADEPETFTLDDLHLVKVPDGRCPHCGRPSDSSEAEAFENLRSELAEARVGWDASQKEAASLKESNDLYDAEVVRLKQKLEDS